MRLPELLFASTLAIFAILAFAIVQGEAPGAGPSAHPDFPSMLRGNGATPSSLTTWLGWAFGALQIAFFAVCFALGLGRRGSLGPLQTPVLASLAVYEIVWAGLVLLDRQFAGDPATPLLLSLPLPTAVMLYLLWPAPLLFLWIYLRHFGAWSQAGAAQRRLDEMLGLARQTREAGDVDRASESPAREEDPAPREGTS
jgi:hypothetical protein